MDTLTVSKHLEGGPSTGTDCKVNSLFIIRGQTSTRRSNPERFSLEELRHNKRKLETLKLLKKNWNSYGGETIDDGVISKVEELLTKLEYQPQLFPTGRGTIQIENYVDEDNQVEVEISNTVIHAYKIKNGKESEEQINFSEASDFISEASDFINDIYVF